MPSRNPSYRWQVLAVVTLTQTLGLGMTWNYVLMVAPDLEAEFGLESWGALWSGIAFGVLVFSISAGALGDRFGVRRVVSAGLLLMWISLLLRADAAQFVTMLATMVLFGMGMALVGSNLPKTIGLWFQSRQLGTANGVSLAGFGLGAGGATLLTPYLLGPVGGWRPLTQIMGYLSLAIAILWWFTIRDRPEASTSRPGSVRLIKSIRQVLRERDVWTVALFYLFFFGGSLAAKAYLPIYFETVRGMSRKSSGTVLAVLAWCYVLGSMLLPTLSDRIGLRKVVYVGGILASCAGCVAAALFTGVPLFLAMAGWGIVSGAVGLLFVVPLEMNRVGSELAGSAIGVATTSGRAASAASPG
jgi:nitrate/nitrite transporter NarK